MERLIKCNSISVDEARLDSARAGYLEFIEACQKGVADFGLTPRAESTAYARCFGVFGLHLLRQKDRLDSIRPQLVNVLRTEVRSMRASYDRRPVDKPYRQLLTFTLSALAILEALEEDPLDDLVVEQLPEDVTSELELIGAPTGRAQSGNQAMFLAIFLLHARDWLGLDVQLPLTAWIDLHIAKMNVFGYWGPGRGMRHLFFQNGYHQYEIFEFLGIESLNVSKAIFSVRSLADAQGHFAPYPGGGGCYDYDAVFMLTPEGKFPCESVECLLQWTSETLLQEQSSDGGWGESRYVRPRSFLNICRFFNHVVSAFPNIDLSVERFRYALTLHRSKHNRIHTHWSRYSRQWDESNLWDSWFRLLAIARIQIAAEPQRFEEWGFINYPGIGYHPMFAPRSQE